jgi:hypothetical protein
MPQSTTIPTNIWKQSWKDPSFRYKLIITLVIFGLILLVFPHFFNYIEQREGLKLNDPLLPLLPPIDASTPIFISIWGITFLVVFRSFKNPQLLLTGLIGFVILTFFRMTTIYFFPLNPPDGLIPLRDPISNHFYGETSFITKDLFFSGHTSSQFLYFLCLQKRSDKILALLSSLIVGTLVLVQHVHYTIDVVAAFPLVVPCYYAARRIVYGKKD